MATVKINEGTKFETPLELEDGENILFIAPVSNRIDRFINPGCLMSLLKIITLFLIMIFVKQTRSKFWRINLVITDRRVVTIPIQPNKKNYMVESFYFQDMYKARIVKPMDKADAASTAKFCFSMKDGGSSKVEGEGEFWIHMGLTAKNILNAVKVTVSHVGTGLANQAEQSGSIVTAHAKTMESQAHAEATGATHYTEYTPNFAAMDKAAKDRLNEIGDNDLDHTMLRDYIMDLVNDCIKIAKG